MSEKAIKEVVEMAHALVIDTDSKFAGDVLRAIQFVCDDYFIAPIPATRVIQLRARYDVRYNTKNA